MAKSIIQEDKTHCYICERNGNGDPLEEHHIFFGTANRKISDKFGLTVHICGNRCHRLGKDSVHKNAQVCRILQAKAQQIAMQHYGWSEDDFRALIGKSYL